MEAFYRDVLLTLNTAGVPYLVGGAYGLACYTPVDRDTKDLDLFIRRRDFESVSAALALQGYRAEMTYTHWLAKIHHGDRSIDLIFSSGNGVAVVDDAWFTHSRPAEVLDIPVHVCPPEETIWSKAFVMERERYDGADVAHLLRDQADHIDWQRLMRRFGAHWRVLFSHLVLFGFSYPGERHRIPAWVMRTCIERLDAELDAAPTETNGMACGGTLLSRQQYLIDVETRGYDDMREQPLGNMTPEELRVWTAAIPNRAPDATSAD
jgi:hypothetical protein